MILLQKEIMGVQQNNKNDSSLNLSGAQDNLPAKNPSVFTTESQKSNSDYPETHDIERELTPDWVLYFSIIFLVLLAWIRLIYSKFIINIFKSGYNYQLAQKVYNEPGIIQKRIFIFLNIFYYLSLSTFLFILARYFNFHFLGLDGLKMAGVFATILLAYSLFRITVMKITAGLFEQQKLFSQALFHNFLYNKICGIIIIPFILLIAYTRSVYQDISVISGLLALVAVNVTRIIRGIIFTSKTVISLFYFILYLCTLEILPVLVIIKLIFSLSKGL